MFFPLPSNQISLKAVTPGLGCLDHSLEHQHLAGCLLWYLRLGSHCCTSTWHLQPLHGAPILSSLCGFHVYFGETEWCKATEGFFAQVQQHPSVSNPELLSVRTPRQPGSGSAAAASITSFPRGHLPVHGLSLGKGKMGFLPARGFWHLEGRGTPDIPWHHCSPLHLELPELSLEIVS